MSEDTFFIGNDIWINKIMVNKKNLMLHYISPFWSCSLPKITFATYNHASSGPLKALGFRTGSKGLREEGSLGFLEDGNRRSILFAIEFRILIVRASCKYESSLRGTTEI